MTAIATPSRPDADVLDTVIAALQGARGGDGVRHFVGPYPPVAPTITGTTISVDAFLQTPTRVHQLVTDLSLQRFVADTIFAAGPPASSGAVIYDQVSQSWLYETSGGDVRPIAPGAEFPLLSSTDQVPLMAGTTKWGAEVFLTYEQIRRNNLDVFGQELTRLRNTVIRRVDNYAVSVLNAAPIATQAASGAWITSTTDVVSDIAQARYTIEQSDLGYTSDLALCNPQTTLSLLKRKDIRNELSLPPDPNAPVIRTGLVGPLMGLTWYQTNRVPAGTIYIMQSKMVGSISDEVPLYAKPIDDPRQERTFIHAARVPVAYITNPLACVKISGA